MATNWRHDQQQREGQASHLARVYVLESKVKGLELALAECQRTMQRLIEVQFNLEATYLYKENSSDPAA